MSLQETYTLINQHNWQSRKDVYMCNHQLIFSCSLNISAEPPPPPPPPPLNRLGLHCKWKRSKGFMLLQHGRIFPSRGICPWPSHFLYFSLYLRILFTVWAKKINKLHLSSKPKLVIKETERKHTHHRNGSMRASKAPTTVTFAKSRSTVGGIDRRNLIKFTSHFLDKL